MHSSNHRSDKRNEPTTHKTLIMNPIKSVNITYDTRLRAKLFASAWALATMKGHDLSKTDKSGKTTVTVYDLTQANLETLKDLSVKY